MKNNDNNTTESKEFSQFTINRRQFLQTGTALVTLPFITSKSIAADTADSKQDYPTLVRKSG
ncbi:Uncharacterised protein [Budvicia aquatica]|uniref:Uncharacterized protein n=1 Tax=Budvicia aquatica TaxID=82979 RepID=A0A484ZJ10_9GAMM|nr:Uncharacterised protein [Budvicia aquatica]